MWVRWKDIMISDSASLRKISRNGEVFCKEEEEVWVCLNCGYVHFGKCAPEKCPACGYPQGYFALNCENY